jgi:hypothetical protein
MIRHKEITPDLYAGYKETNWSLVLLGLILIGFLATYTGRMVGYGNRLHGNGNTNVRETRELGEVASPCIQVQKGFYQCSDKESLAKWNAYLESEVKHYEENTITASVSMYSPKETCPDGVFNKCKDASGHRPIGANTLACPRKYGLGTRFSIGKDIYNCTDRTAKWIEDKYGPTFDIFTESYQAAKAFGRKRMQVTILN